MKARHPVARHLRQLGAGLAPAFALPLRDRSGPLACDRLLRLVAGKRAAFSGHYGSDEVIAKLFFQRGRHRALCKRELDGLLALADCGCETPAILYTGAASDNAVTVLLLKWLPGSQSVLARWQKLTDDAERLELLLQLTDTLARQHLGGIWQADLQLGSFLWHDGRIICIDGDEVQRQRGPLATAVGLDNFAQLCAQLPPRWDHLLLQAFQHYQRLRFAEQRLDWRQFQPRVQRHRRQRFAAMQSQAGGPTTWLASRRENGCRIVVQKDWDGAELSQLAAAPDVLLADSEPVTSPAPAASAEQTVRHRWTSGVVDIRRFPPPPWWRRLLGRSFGGGRPSRAERAFCNAHALRLFEIDTPLPIAQLDRPDGSSLLICANGTGTVSLADFLTASDAADAGARQSFDRVLDLLAELASLQLLDVAATLDDIRIRDGRPVLHHPDRLRLQPSVRRHRRRYSRQLQRLQQQLAAHPAWLQPFIDGLRVRGLR